MKKRLFSCIVLAVWAFGLLNGCKHDPIIVDPFIPNSSWELIQHNIFEPKCVACHSPNSRFAQESDLILNKETGYENLLNRKPFNSAAENEGLWLLRKEGIKSLEESFLWEKINAPNAEHFYQDHPHYGEMMPLGGPFLTNGELAYIKEWIIQGAPKTGWVADDSLLLDHSQVELPQTAAKPLDPPPQGIQFHMGPFRIKPGTERELFYYEPLENEEAIYISGFEISMKIGSHHFLMHRYPGDKPESRVYRDLYRNNGRYVLSTLRQMKDRIYIFGSQYRFADYFYPPGVALKFPANDGIDFNTHYVNFGEEDMIGEAWVNLHTLAKEKVMYEAENLFINNKDFKLPPKKITTISNTHIFEDEVQLILLFSHAHKRNTEFRIYLEGGPRDGELIYFSRDWQHPPMIDFNPPIILKGGTGLRGEAVYSNMTNKTIKFGTSEDDEMMIMSGTIFRN
ncbi:MAG: hypothetical protein R8P61_30480 [Bacteroidia bacterium]|nr:hypothetical protein [Bacteroidia bacterium]